MSSPNSKQCFEKALIVESEVWNSIGKVLVWIGKVQDRTYDVDVVMEINEFFCIQGNSSRRIPGLRRRRGDAGMPTFEYTSVGAS
jgi:hypothetical protein